MTEIDSRDKDGHFCGQNDETGEMTPSPPDKVGYCGPNCVHCHLVRVYVLQDGIWVCAADYNYEEKL